MIVVSDTSAIINLASIGQLDLLHRLFDQILIPESVFDEIVVSGAGRPGAADVAQQSWIQSRRIVDRALVDVLLVELDLGEAEAIVLAREVGSDLLLIDERRGRAVADRLGITKIGLIGVLVLARRSGEIAALRPLLDALRDDAGFWIRDELYDRVLDAVDER